MTPSPEVSPRVIRLSAIRAFLGSSGSNEYTNTFVSRKNLASLIHFVAGKLAPSPYMAKTAIQICDFFPAYRAGSILPEPLPKGVVQGLMLTARDFAGAVNRSFISAECNISHD